MTYEDFKQIIDDFYEEYKIYCLNFVYTKDEGTPLTPSEFLEKEYSKYNETIKKL